MYQDNDNTSAKIALVLVVGLWLMLPASWIKHEMAYAQEREQSAKTRKTDAIIKQDYAYYTDSMRTVNTNIKQEFDYARDKKINAKIAYYANVLTDLEYCADTCKSSITNYQNKIDSVCNQGADIDTNGMAKRIQVLSAEKVRLQKKINALEASEDKFFDTIYNAKPKLQPVMSFADFKDLRKMRNIHIRNTLGCNYK